MGVSPLGKGAKWGARFLAPMGFGIRDVLSPLAGFCLSGYLCRVGKFSLGFGNHCVWVWDDGCQNLRPPFVFGNRTHKGVRTLFHIWYTCTTFGSS